MVERIVIYPAGRVGEDIAYLLKFTGVLEENVLLVDDASAFDLEAYLKVRKPDDVVCIASERYFFDIARKLDVCGITYCNGMAFVAKALDQYFMQRKSPALTVGVITAGPSGGKHRGNIEAILKENGFEVVFLCADEEEMVNAKERIGDSAAFVLREKEIIKRITFASVIISEGGELFHPSVTCVYIPHTVAFPADGLSYEKLIVPIMMDRCIENNAFIAAPGKTMHHLWESYMQHAYLKTVGTHDKQDLYSFSYKIKPLGLPTLDRYQGRAVNIKNKSNQVFVCLNHNVTSLKRARSLVLELLEKGFEVLYRPHPIQKNTHLHQSMKALFSSHSRFIFDTALKIPLQAIEQGILMVVDLSSLAYSYAIATQTPVVLYFNAAWKKRITSSKWGGGGFYAQKLHRIAQTPREVIACMEEIYECREACQQEVVEYISEDIYNFGCASEKIAEFIMDILKYKQKAL